MNLSESRSRISRLMAIFVDEVKNENAMDQTDINTVSETVLIPLFAEVYGYRNLRNLNITEHSNYPAIDLADDDARVAFQITSRANLEKVKDTLKTFIRHKLYEKYERLYIYVLTERQESYSADACKKIVQDIFDFDPARDIIDRRDILRIVKGFQIDKTRLIQEILEANFGEGEAPLVLRYNEQLTESVHLNLLELFFPTTLYIANLAFDDKSVPRTREYYRGPYGRRTPRELVQDALNQLGLILGVDWEFFQNQIITFHDLSDTHSPLAQLVDQGTVTPIDPVDFYGQDENQERVFKTLLGRCLQQKLYLKHVRWQYQDKLFIFSDKNGEESRIEKWHGKQRSERVVFERVMKNNKPDEILQCKHLAFETQYKRFSNKWYLLIKPDWFFSRDGYRRSEYGSKNIEWLKRKESNSQVFNHFRFIAYFLTHDEPSGLFVERPIYPYLWFGEFCTFESAPTLNDNEWNPPRAREEEDSAQLEMFDL